MVLSDDKESAYTDESEFEIGSSDCEKRRVRPLTEYACEYCNMKFRKHAKYIRHLRTHTKEKPFICEYPNCGKAFSRKDHLVRHMTSHSEELSYPCLFEGCQKKFKSEYNLNRHMRKHLQKEVTPQQSYKCSYCEMEFTKKQQLRKHEFLHTGIKPFCCSFPGCNHSYFQSSHLANHEKTHQNDKSLFVCSMTDCGFSTKSVDEFKEHMKQQHSLVKQDTPVKLINRIPCTIPGCSKTFMNKKTLASHIATVHNHEKYKCPTCGRVYAQLSSLSRHKRVHHMAESDETRQRVLTTIAGKVGYDIYPSLSPFLVKVDPKDLPATTPDPSPQPPSEPESTIQTTVMPTMPTELMAHSDISHDESSSDSEMLTEGSSEEEDDSIY